MGKKSRIGMTALCFCLCTVAYGQAAKSFAHTSNDDISVSGGWMIPLVQGDFASDCSEGQMRRVDYRHYFPNRMGFGVGAQHVCNYMDVDGHVGMPLSFVWRSRLHDFDEVFGGSLYNALTYDPFEGYDQYYMERYVENPLAQDFVSKAAVFFLGLVNRAEFRAGLTPGYVYGNGRTHHSAYTIFSGQDRYTWSGMKGSEVGKRFCVSADLGANLSYRIWRFTINLTPEFHYIITDSYRIYSKPDNGYAETRPQRWQFSMLFSLDLML